MKNKITRLIFILTVFLGAVNQLSAQSYKVNLYSGYTFDDEIDAVTNNNNYVNGTIIGGYQWGLGFEYIVKPTYGIELSYYRQDTDFDINYNTSADTNASRDFGTGINFIMLGGNKYLPIPRSIVQPYGGLMLGSAILENKDPLPGAESSTTKFAWGGRAGIFLNFSKNVGLKIHGQLLSAVQSVNGGLYLGTGGVDAGLSSESSMYQFGVGGALVIQFGGPSTKVRR